MAVAAVVLEAYFRLYGLGNGFADAPGRAVKNEDVVLIQLVSLAVAETEHRALIQLVVLIGAEFAVEIEGQNNGAVCVRHTDPAHVLIAGLSEVAAIVRGQEVGDGGGCGQVGIDLKRTGVAPAIGKAHFRLYGLGRCGRCVGYGPIGAVPNEHVVLIQLVGLAVAETEHRALGQLVILTVGKLAVKVEGQNDGAVCVRHTDPAHVLIAGLSEVAAIVRGQEVGDGGGCGQVGIDLKRIGIAPAIRKAYFRLYRIGRCGDSVGYGPIGAVPNEYVGLIQGEGAAIGEAEDRVLLQDIVLIGGEGIVEIECQRGDAVHHLHADPAYLLTAGLGDIAAIVRSQEVGAGDGFGQVGIQPDGIIRAVAVLQLERTLLGCFRLGDILHSGPGRAVPLSVEGGFNSYGSGIVIDDRAFHNGYYLALMVQLFQTHSGGIQVSVKGRLVHFLALQQDLTLEADGGAVGRRAEVVDIRELDQVIHGEAGDQRHIGHQLTGSTIRERHILGLGDLGNFGNSLPAAAVPLGIEGLVHHHSGIAEVDHRILQNGEYAVLMGCLQGDGGIGGVAHEQGIVHQLAVQHHSALEAQGGIAGADAEIIHIHKLHHAVCGVAGLQLHSVLHLLDGAVREGDVLGCGGCGDLAHRNPAAAVPLGIEGILHLHGNAAVVDHGVLLDGQDLAAVGDLEANGVGIGIAHHLEAGALQLLAVQQNSAGEAQRCVVPAHTEVEEGGKLHQILGGIAGDQLAGTGAHHALAVHPDGVVGILQGNVLEDDLHTGVDTGEGAVGSEDQLHALQRSVVGGDIDLKLMELAGVILVQLQHAQLLAGVVIHTDLAVAAVGHIHVQHQGGVVALFQCLGELEPQAGHHAPGAGADLCFHALRGEISVQIAGSVAVVLRVGAEVQPIVKQLRVQRIVKLCHAVAGIQAVNTGHGLAVQGGNAVTQGGDPDIALIAGQAHGGFADDVFFAVEDHPIAGSTLHRGPGSPVAVDGELGIRQNFSDGHAVHIQGHIVEVAGLSVEAQLHAIRRVAAFIEGGLGIVDSVGIHTDIFHRVRAQIHRHPLAGLQAGHIGGEGSGGSVRIPECHIVAAKEEVLPQMLALHIQADGQVLTLQVLLGEGLGQTQADGVVAIAGGIVEAHVDLQNALGAFKFRQIGVGVISVDLIILVDVAALHQIAVAFLGIVRQDALGQLLGRLPGPVFDVPLAVDGGGIAVAVRSGQLIGKSTEGGDLIGVIDLTEGILLKFRIPRALELQGLLQIDARAGGCVLHGVKGQLIHRILGDILQKQAVGDLQKLHNGSGGIHHGEGNALVYIGIRAVGILDAVSAGLELEGGILVRHFGLVSLVDDLIQHIIGDDLALLVGDGSHRELDLATGVFDGSAVRKLSLHGDGILTLTAGRENQKHTCKQKQQKKAFG